MQPKANLEGVVSLSAILGHLNFSEGKPDHRFQKQLNDAYGVLAQGAYAPRSDSPRQQWEELYQILTRKLEALKKEGGAFQDARQAEAVLRLTFAQILPAYRRHHSDLLAHLSDAELFRPFFLARVVEAVMSQGPPWDEAERIVAG